MLDSRTVPEPTWTAPGPHDQAGDPEVAAQRLADLDDTDLQLCVLTYGFGLSLGDVADILHMDPAVVSWRLRSIVSSEERPGGDELLERAITDLLRGLAGEVTTAPPASGASWRAEDLVESFPDPTRQRLETRLGEGEDAAGQTRSGLGIGVVVLVGLVVLAFTIYGAFLDRNPLLRGKDLIRRGQFGAARVALSGLGRQPEAQKWTAFAYLAEGHYDRALEIMEDPEFTEHFGAFRPVPLPLVAVEFDPQSRALLPRGLTMERRPIFQVAPGPGGDLKVETPTSERRLDLPDSKGASEALAVAYPEGWEDVPRNDIVWSVPAEDGTFDIAAFTVISGVQQKEINSDLVRHLPNEIPQPARAFLRGHYLLRSRLYMRAAHQFAQLAERFPGRAYPQDMLDNIGEALGVDPTLLLR